MNENTNMNGKTTGSQRTHYVRTEDGFRTLVPGVPTRTDQVVSWLGWHFFELAAVLVSAGLAVTVTRWLWLLTAAVTAGWIGHEVRDAQEQAAVKAGRELPASTTAAATGSPETGEVPE